MAKKPSGNDLAKLYQARFESDVQELVGRGTPRAEAERLTKMALEGVDVLIEDTNGTPRFWETRPDDLLAPLPD
jgi:hypothetical protein